MGVKFGREYNDILRELTEAVEGIADSYRFFEMEPEEWEALGEAEKKEVMEALADDLFYSLGADPSTEVGSGKVCYDAKHHIIKVDAGDKLVRIVHLV